ncbi:MAG: cysteine desulfurase family protein [Actinomycetota bacterium]|nr:cysteine desulfurase family protein [Actinomycetota bacterium]
MDKPLIYLDNNATTPLHPRVKEAMTCAMEVFGNPSSLHAFGRKARRMVEEARESVATFIGANPEEIIFTGSGSEGNNTILSMFTSCGCHCSFKNKVTGRLITTAIEHPCILETSECLIDKGVSVTKVGVDAFGKIDMDELKKAMDEEAGLVSVMMANNEIGTIQDIAKIAKMAKERGVFFHSDAVQAVGKIEVDVKELGVDFLTLSAHKIYGPKGIGAIYVKSGVPICPMIRGGHQERGLRAGTENTIGIVGLGKAIEMRRAEMADESKRLLTFKTKLIRGIKEKIADVRFNGHPTDSLNGTVSVSFAGAEGESILLYLDLEGIAVSTASACASGSLDPSHVLMATGMPIEQAHGSIRISMGRETTEKDIDYVLEVLPRVIEKIRSMSSVYTRPKACG